MTLEATIICLDNSDFGRNGDYSPKCRFDAQCEAAQLLCGVKTQTNAESLVGILTLAGERIDVRVTPTRDLGKVLQSLHSVPIYGNIDVVKGIQTAQLALKHRVNKNLRQRIICFVGSPMDSISEKSLEKLGKLLKKNNVSLDIISYGEVEENSTKLSALYESVNNNSTSHILEIPPGSTSISDALMSSPIVMGEGDGQSVAFTTGMGGNSTFEFGVDPSADPELYMALRMSMEEERARQTRQEGAQMNESSDNAATEKQANVEMKGPNDVDINSIPGLEEMDEELRQAIILSLSDSKQEESEKPKESTTSSSAALTDPSFIEQIISSLPGVDVSDPRIQDALKAMQDQDSSNKMDEKKDSDDQ